MVCHGWQKPECKPYFLVYQRSRCEAGFTLTELMIVVAMISVLSTFAIPSFKRYRQKAHDLEALTTLTTAKKSLLMLEQLPSASGHIDLKPGFAPVLVNVSSIADILPGLDYDAVKHELHIIVRWGNTIDGAGLNQGEGVLISVGHCRGARAFAYGPLVYGNQSATAENAVMDYCPPGLCAFPIPIDNTYLAVVRPPACVNN